MTEGGEERGLGLGLTRVERGLCPSAPFVMKFIVVCAHRERASRWVASVWPNLCCDNNNNPQLKIGKMGPEFGGKVGEMLWRVLGQFFYAQTPSIGPEF